MSRKDIYYGAFVDYRKNTREDKDCARQRKYIARANADGDKIEVITTECEIDDDWIIAIENGLEFIDKAIKEERQFILSNGEVVPIEKVKNVSKESVDHLAKHSNLVSRLPKEGADLVPDQLYTVERLTDFAVYENRFLYMLLCYLRDFIALRYNKIVELVTTYNGTLALEKEIAVGDRKTKVRVNLDEHLRNDEYLREHNSSKEKIDRIDGLFKAVVSFLSQPLMEEVSKAPMLKPPITETNVLKMNKNFKGAMQLYYFVTAYTKKGYTTQTTTRTLHPFKERVADDLSEVVDLCSFLTYEHGMGIEAHFKKNYEERLRREKELEEQKKLEQLKALRKRIRESGESPEEYMLMLEQRNRLLEEDRKQLVRARLEIKALQEKIALMTEELNALRAELAECKEKLAEKEREIARMIEKHAQEIARIQEEHEEEIARLNEEHESEIYRIREEHAEEISQIEGAHAEEIAALNDLHQREVSTLTDGYEEKLAQTISAHEEEKAQLISAHEAERTALIAAHTAQVAQMQAEHEEKVAALTNGYENEITGLKRTHQRSITYLNATHEAETAQLKYELASDRKALMESEDGLREMTERQTLTAAKLNALKYESGLYDGDENYTSQEGFGEIERQYKTFKAFFKQQWRLTKKKIKAECASAVRAASQEAVVAPTDEEALAPVIPPVAQTEGNTEEIAPPVATAQTAEELAPPIAVKPSEEITPEEITPPTATETPTDFAEEKGEEAPVSTEEREEAVTPPVAEEEKEKSVATPPKKERKSLFGRKKKAETVTPPAVEEAPEEVVPPVATAQTAEELAPPIRVTQTAEELAPPIRVTQTAEELAPPIRVTQTAEELASPIRVTQTVEALAPPIKGEESVVAEALIAPPVAEEERTEEVVAEEGLTKEGEELAPTQPSVEREAPPKKKGKLSFFHRKQVVEETPAQPTVRVEKTPEEIAPPIRVAQTLDEIAPPIRLATAKEVLPNEEKGEENE